MATAACTCLYMFVNAYLDIAKTNFSLENIPIMCAHILFRYTDPLDL